MTNGTDAGPDGGKEGPIIEEPLGPCLGTGLCQNRIDDFMSVESGSEIVFESSVHNEEGSAVRRYGSMSRRACW